MGENLDGRRAASWDQLCDDAREAQAEVNRPWFERRLAPTLAQVPAVHDVLSRPGARVVDVGCGFGWSTLALARAYPEAVLHGVDVDRPSVDAARAAAVAAGVLHFIPYLGPALTALATGMAGFMQFESLSMAVLVAFSSLAIATFVGMVLITWMCGKMSKMNTTAVFVALLFGGWLWGVWGLLVAIPIMGIVKVFAERVEDLQPLAELLSE